MFPGAQSAWSGSTGGPSLASQMLTSSVLELQKREPLSVTSQECEQGYLGKADV
jgi:hypothetical protein